MPFYGLLYDHLRIERPIPFRHHLTWSSCICARCQAEAQAREYGASLKQRDGLQRLLGLAVVALGVERLVLRLVAV